MSISFSEPNDTFPQLVNVNMLLYTMQSNIEQNLLLHQVRYRKELHLVLFCEVVTDEIAQAMRVPHWRRYLYRPRVVIE